MAAARARISCGVSSTTPLGGAAKPSCVGRVAWQATQRAWMTGWTWSKATGPPPSALGRGSASTAVSPSMTRPAASTSGLALPL